MLPFTEKVNILYLKRKEKIYAEDAQIFGNSESSIHETVKMEKKEFVPVLTLQNKLQPQWLVSA